VDNEQVTLKIPPVGFSMACEPCGECLRIIDRMSHERSLPGQQADCYVCQNRVTVSRTERTEASIMDRYSALSGYDETVKDYKLVALAFDKNVWSDRGIPQWMKERDLSGFNADKVTADREWSIHTKTKDSEAMTFVRLDSGVLGRVIQEVVQV